MKQVILAKRYAKAIFSVAEEENKLEEYGSVINSFAALLEKKPEVKDALTNPLYPIEAREKVMEGLVKAAKLEKPLANFMDLLVEKKRAGILSEIAETYQLMLDEKHNISHGEVITATKLTKALSDKIQTTLEKLTGKQIVLQANVDPSIIGGMIARVGDLELDGSIRTQLAGLKDSIKGR